MDKIKFTPSQSRVLESHDNQILVSASAGSGKTATVIEKIFKSIESGRADLEELLVITFTEAASAEMKLRLKEKFFEASAGDRKIKEQIDKLSLADISTIHAFCSKMLRKYFFKLQINPNFKVLDDADAKYLKASALEKVLDKFSAKHSQNFVVLAEAFGGGRTFAGLKASLLDFYEFLCSLKDKDDFLKKSKICYENNLDKNIACKILNDYLVSSFGYFSNQIESFLVKAGQMKADKFENFLSVLKSQISGVTLSNTFEKNAVCLFEISLPRMLSGKLSLENADFKQSFSPFWKSFLKQLSKLKELFLTPHIEELSKNLSAAQELIDVFIDVLLAFEEEYFGAKNRRNVLDFSDLERHFLTILNDDEVASEIKNSYKFVFVDEYQDINDVQEFILSKISNGKNLIMVGDVKQSIYGFRNSSPQIFVDKSIRFEEDSSGLLINLNENFRSNPQVLEFVNAIFNVCMSKEFGGVDYKKDGRLIGKTEYKDSGLPIIKLCLIDKSEAEDEPEKFVYDKVYSVLGDKNDYKQKATTARREAMIVADNILNLVGKDFYDAKEKVFKKIKFGDIALLCRTNDFLREVSNVLLEYNVPVATNLKDNIYTDKDVLCLISMLKLLDNLHDDISSVTALTSVFGKLNFDELSMVRQKYPDEKFFYNALKKYSTENTDAVAQKLKKFYEIVYELRERLTYQSLYDLLNFLENKFDFLAYFNALPDGNTRVKTLREFINSFQNAPYNFDLNKFLDYVENFAKDSKVSSHSNSNVDAVKVQTIHSCKGREFPIVFLVGCGKSFSNRSMTGEILKDKDLGLGFYAFDFENHQKKSTLARSAIGLKIKKEERAEELRLLYVALTRAKNHLIMVGETSLSNVSRAENFKQAEIQNNYMGWILSGLSQLAFENLTTNKKGFSDRYDGFEVQIEVFNKDTFEYKKPVKNRPRFEEGDPELKRQIQKQFDFKFERRSDVALKNTVSSMLAQYSDEMTNVNVEPRKLTVNENLSFDIDTAKLGTYYHKIMQEIDFNQRIDFQVDEIFSRLKISKKYLDKIDKTKIINCANYIKELGIIEMKKEQPFLSFLPYNFIFKNSGVSDKVVIQGVADLIVKTKEKTLLIDYKITRADRPDQLVEKYKLQLLLYKICLEKATNTRIDEAYVYSFWFEKLIKIV